MSLLAITDAGVAYKDAVFAGEELQNITRVIFRNVDGLLPDTAIDLTQSLPSEDIVHSEPIERVSALDDNAVVMSTVLGYDIGDFEYNWYGVVAQKEDLSEVLIAVVQTPVQTKTKTDGATTGNYSVKSIVWKTANIAESLNVTLSALPWQVDDETFVTQITYELGMDEKLDKTANAQNALKLGNQLPAYYATKDALDALSALIASDDVSLDEIQEIVSYIKLNRSDLDALSISSIAGLVTALAGKSATGHGHSLASLGYTGANNANYFTYSLPSSVVHQTEKSALHLTDALRISGHRIYLYKGDGTSEYVDVPDNDTNTHRACDNTPRDGKTTTSISSNWAFDNVKTSVPVNAKFTDTNTWRLVSSSVSSTSTSVSASSAAVRSAYNKANHSHPYAAISHTHSVTRTTLLNSASGITSGNLSLSGWKNYDMLEVIGVDVNDNRSTTNFHTPSSLILGLASASDGKYVLWDNGSGAHWWIKGQTSSSLTYDSDNARILRIVGIKFTA